MTSAFHFAGDWGSFDVMVQGEDSPPGERRCPDCDRRWYSAALLNDDEADCPVCGARLASAAEAEDRA